MNNEKNILILGANSDLGIAIAENYAKNSFVKLHLASKNKIKLNNLKSDISIRFNSNIEIYELNIIDTKNHTSFLKKIKNIDIAYCVFGYLGENDESFSEWSEAEKIIMTNYVGAVSILNKISKKFIENKKGIIVGVSSVAGERGRMSNFIYGSAKAGFTTYLSGLRNYLYDHNIHVLTVLPGFMRTKMITNIKTPQILTADPSKAAFRIINAVEKKKNIIYVLGIWKYIMLIIKNIPENIFKKLSL